MSIQAVLDDAKRRVWKLDEVIARDIALAIAKEIKPGATDFEIERLQLAIEHFLR